MLWHQKLEKSIFILLVWILIVTSVGGIVQIFPLFVKEIAIEEVEGMRPHTPLELLGFELYKREGCYNCHSQQIRKLRGEVERYGHYSLAAESMYDNPFQWSSKRTGPDLARIGERYSDDWHIDHLIDPQSLVPDSLMPKYKFLADTLLDTSEICDRMSILAFIGTPYTDEDIASCLSDISVQLGLTEDQDQIAGFEKRYPKAIVRKFYKRSDSITEMDAMVAYLQHLGNKVDMSTNQGRVW